MTDWRYYSLWRSSILKKKVGRLLNAAFVNLVWSLIVAAIFCYPFSYVWAKIAVDILNATPIKTEESFWMLVFGKFFLMGFRRLKRRNWT